MDATPVLAAEPGLQADAGVPWHASLRTRLMLWVGLLLALLLLAGYATAFYAARSRIVADAEARTRFEAQQAADRLDAAMRSVRISGESLIDLGNRVELTRAELLAAMEAMLDANPSTVGGLVALEPGVLADRARLAYYVGIAARGVPDRDLLADGYDLVGRDWYQRTLQATSPWWSEPYFSETAGGRYMTTLNLPLRDRQAKRIGMVSLDVPVQALSSSLESLRTLGQRTALFAPAGTIAVHPEQGVAFAHTLAGYMLRNDRGDLAPMEAARAQRHALQFTHVDARTGATRYSVLQPVGDSGWSLQLSLGRGAMLADLERAMRMLGLIGALVALLAALAVLRLARQITEPLTELTASAGHFASGEFEWPVPHDARGDEVGVMARALERARDSIRLQLDEIGRYAAEQQKLQSELDIARDIQRSMLPRDRDFASGPRNYRLQARLEPAKAVGGDFHGHFLHGDGQLWFVVGDVSDKGVPAALFMARALTVLQVAAAAGDGDRPDRVLAEAARHLAEGNDACMFATVLCGVLDLASGGLAIASAGHDAPLLRHADASIEAIPLESGPALGFDAVATFQVWRGRLQPGDLLFAYTDGVTEAFDRDDRAFGEDRLRDALQAARGAADACDGLLLAVHHFAAGAARSDDITVFAIDCSAAPAAGEWSLRVPDQRGRLPGVLDAVAATLGKAGIDPRCIHDAQVIVEELVCNLMDHGAPAGVDALVLGLAIDDGQVVIDLRDNGAAYDPLAHPPPDLDADITQRPVGGLGIHLVRELSRDAQYRRQDGWNVLRVVLDAILPPS